MNNLKKKLQKIDGRGYKAYKEIQGCYQFSTFTLAIDHVQGDPFASPSKIRIIVQRAKTNLENALTDNRRRTLSCEDVFARAVSKAIHKKTSGVSGSGKSGLVTIDTPGQEVIERTAVSIDDKQVTLCLSVGLPARGRKILGRQAEQLFFELIPDILKSSVFAVPASELEDAVQLNDKQHAIREYMKAHDLIAFVGNGAILPRSSGISNKPLQTGKVVPFTSPSSLEVSIPVPHQDEPVTGMGIKKGITLIVGGGYHGKSTLLEAIERGVYNHVSGDGREFVLTDPSAVKIRAEDGRKVTNVNISPFIKNLPHGKDTERFTTENASGSTSQASNIIEALEAKAETLLIDEDTSATNFMIRDSRMQALVAKNKEPITPFVDKVQQLYNQYGISSILVMGGSGDYFDAADKVVMMEQYLPHDVTDEAKKIASDIENNREVEGGKSFGEINERILLTESLDSRKGKKNKVKVRGKTQIQYGKTDILLHDVEQLVDASQTRMIGEILTYVEQKKLLNGGKSLAQLLEAVEKQIDERGLASFTRFPEQHPGELARPRMQELAAALNRLRTLAVKS
ncbi:ABC-ATPase domain-containing protein [Bacillus tianshenii]|nr:ABC-ATPase domain-containing protein [Bacillus tianshenii]